MWRSFFLAIGTMLIISGVQCIVVGEFTVSTDSSLAKMGKRIVSSGQGVLLSQDGNAESGPGRDSITTTENRGFGGQAGRSSMFGDSRSTGSRFGNDQFFNATPASSNANSPFQLPGRADSSTTPQLVSQSNGLSSKPRIFQTEDWMPWSLIAAGVIVVLYTKSWQTQRGSD